MASTIPVVDLEGLFLNFQEKGEEIVQSLHSCGFLYLQNHGIDMDKVRATFAASKVFFEQPMERKLLHKVADSPKGYHPQGYTIKGEEDLILEVRECFDVVGRIKKEQDEEESTFTDALLRLQAECHPLVRTLLRLLGTGLKLEDPDFFLKRSKWLEDPEVPSFKTFRTLYYPAIPERIDIPEGVMRVKEHSDFDFLTLLFQDDIGGLEIKLRSGQWIPATPIPNTIIVNIGDLLEAWSGGYFPSTKHRVLIPESEIRKRVSRQSIAYFLHPDSNTLVTPLNSPSIQPYTFPEFRAYEHTKAKLAGVKSY